MRGVHTIGGGWRGVEDTLSGLRSPPARVMQQPPSGQRRRPSAGQTARRRPVALAGWTRSGGRAEAGPGGGGQQLDVAVRQHLVMAEGVAEPAGGHNRQALGVQAATLDVGAVDA